MMKIGMFDSGVGGLTVLKSVYDKFPNNEYIYIGDNKNSPYGDKSKEELYCYATRIIDYFIEKDIKLIVIACNTICSNILPILKEKYKDITLIGVIDSTINSFVKRDKKNVLVIAPNKTISSNVYEDKIKSINKDINVYSLSTPLLVPMIECGIDTTDILHKYFEPYTDIDSIILGCTHYKIIEDKIDKDALIINSSDGVVEELDSYLDNNGISKLEIYTTGYVFEFNKLCTKIIGIEGNYIDL